jgi:predicted ATP-grasp superfamily ATP-dependent carboligase
LKLLVYEHVSARGLSDKLQPSVLCEGFGMLRTLVADAKAAGHNVTTVLDNRILQLKPLLETDHVLTVHAPEDTVNTLQEAAAKADATLVIAPETNGTLQNLVERIERSSTLSLNCSANAIEQVSDKTRLQQHAKKIGLSTPETIVFHVKDDAEDIAQIVTERISFPAVLKPTDTVGCEALSIANNEKQAKVAAAKIAKYTSTRFMAQKLIQGTPASVTLISNGTETQPITLNKQNVSLKTPSQTSSYNGGTTPLNHKLENAAFKTAKKLVESVKGLKGYIGVDLVLTENEPVIIEVNPRLTTSYVGIRRVVKANLAQAIMDATVKHRLPPKQENNGYAHFEKVKTTNSTGNTLQQTFSLPELVSPPFATANGSNTYALLCTQGSTAQQAKRNFNKAKKQLRNIVLSGGEHKR